LIKALGDEDKDTRERAAKALGEIETQEQSNRLRRHFKIRWEKCARKQNGIKQDP